VAALAGGMAASAELTAVFAQIGGVGSGLITEILIRLWDRLGDSEEREVSQREFRDELAAELDRELTGNSAAAAALRVEVSTILRHVDRGEGGTGREFRGCLRVNQGSCER